MAVAGPADLPSSAAAGTACAPRASATAIAAASVRGRGGMANLLGKGRNRSSAVRWERAVAALLGDRNRRGVTVGSAMLITVQ
ncbi:hypothetical protein GCM10010279_26770 [Streptomyces mutabilis]|nr:hypothetical protein GCM10010279_26770 [Streptomyces mutabilis]